MRGIKTMSLDAWLFGDDAQQQQQAGASEPAAAAAGRPPRPLSASKTQPQPHSNSNGNSDATAPSPSVAQGVGRSNSLPVNSLSNRMATRAKKASLALVLPPPSISTSTSALPKATPKGTDPPSTPHSELFPVSSKLRKLFRPNRLQWNRGRQSLAMTPEEKQRQLLGLSSASFQRLQGHVPFTLKEIVKDPKKLPYLLRWLSADDEELQGPSAARTNYHQVLLFLLEIEQLQLVADEKRREQALKIWHKYIDHESEFQIATTLELTHELEALVRDSIDCSDKVLDSFFPIQKLAYMRLTREEMPRFLKSPEYLQMLIDTENDTESVPMERILQQPRAAHYFLLFLMQSRQHFELYFWLHVEYVLKPLLETEETYDAFWKLARVLLKKAQNDSQAITLATKNDLQDAIHVRKMDDKLQPPQPVAKALFARAQQEIFVMLRSSWFHRFMKSNLYKIALKDCQIHSDTNESKEDSPPKLLSRTFSSLEYSALRLHDNSDDEETPSPTRTPPIAEDKHDEIREDGPDEFIGSPSHQLLQLSLEASNELPSGSDDSSGVDSDSSEGGADDSLDFSKMVLNLESIIRLTKLPDGLQVHYRPHYDSPTTGLVANDSCAANGAAQHQQDLALDAIVTFSTVLDKKGKGDPKATLMLSPVENPRQASTKSSEDLFKRIKSFLVPDGRVVVKKSACGGKPPSDIIFPFQQSGRNGFLYGYVYLTYDAVPVGRHQKVYYAAKGVCILSRFPLVRTLRGILESHLTHTPVSERFDSMALTKLFVNDVPVPSTQFVSQIPVDLMRRRTRSESGAAQRALRKALIDTRVDVSVRPLFEYFGSAIALQILACALLECSIVFVSSQYSLLTACAEAVRCLLRPFSWCHVYAPVLPKPLLSYLQCPTPIVVGLQSTYADRADLPTSGFCAVADLDRHVLEFVDPRYTVSWRRLGLQQSASTSPANTVFLPAAFEKAKIRLDKIFRPVRADETDSVPWTSSSSSGLTLAGAPHADSMEDVELYGSALKNDEERVRVACFELLSGLLEGHTEACLVVGDTKESVVIFDETQFLTSRTAAEDGPFYQALFRTQCFSEIVSAHRIDVSAVEEDAVDGDVTDGVV